MGWVFGSNHDPLHFDDRISPRKPDMENGAPGDFFHGGGFALDGCFGRAVGTAGMAGQTKGLEVLELAAKIQRRATIAVPAVTGSPVKAVLIGL